MTPAFYANAVVAPVMEYLLPELDSPQARRMLIAIAMQESGLRHRRQVRGPARGLHQFEVGGVVGVRTHPATQAKAAHVLRELSYDVEMPSSEAQAILEHNDMLDCAFARLNLYWLPMALPNTEIDGWTQYLEAWRPGKPHPDRWPNSWAEGAYV